MKRSKIVWQLPQGKTSTSPVSGWYNVDRSMTVALPAKDAWVFPGLRFCMKRETADLFVNFNRTELIELGISEPFLFWTNVALVCSEAMVAKKIADTFEFSGFSVKAHVVRVIDGDTCVIRTKIPIKKIRCVHASPFARFGSIITDLKVRWYAIDTPERGTPDGERAKREAEELVRGRRIRIHFCGNDKYGRTLGILIYDGQILNQLMVERGFAKPCVV